MRAAPLSAGQSFTRGARIERAIAGARLIGAALLAIVGPRVPNTGVEYVLALALYVLVYDRALAFGASRGTPASRTSGLGLILDGSAVVFAMFVFSAQPSWDITIVIPMLLLVAAFRLGRRAVLVGLPVLVAADVLVSLYRAQHFGFAFSIEGSVFRIGIYSVASIVLIGLLQQLNEVRTVQTTLFEPLLEAQDALGEAILIREGDRLTTISDAFVRLSGYDRSEVPDLAALLQMVPDDERALVRERIGSATQDRFDMRLRRKDGQIVDVEVARTAVEGSRVVTLVRDITQRKRAEQELERSVLRDPLTGLPTAAILRDRIWGALAEVRRRDASFCVMLLVLPGFRFVTQTVGPAGAHQILFELAGRLRGRMREVDSAARVGPEAFGALLADCDAEGGRRFANAISSLLAQPYEVSPLATGPLVIRPAIGLATGPADGETADALLRAAEAAAWHAVRTNVPFVVYEPGAFSGVEAL